MTSVNTMIVVVVTDCSETPKDGAVRPTGLRNLQSLQWNHTAINVFTIRSFTSEQSSCFELRIAMLVRMYILVPLMRTVLKFDTATTTGSQGNLTYFMYFPWPSIEAAMSSFSVGLYF